MKSLDFYYDDYLDIEASADEILNQSLSPRGPQMLFDLVEKLALPSGAAVLDAGCGEGAYSLELARRFGFSVTGIDPIPRHMQLAGEALKEATAQDPALGSLVRFVLGTAEQAPVQDNSIDFIWCRDVLVHVPQLDQAFAEFKRVLRQQGKILILHSFATDLMEPREAAWLWSTMRVVPANTDPAYFEQKLAEAGLRIEDCTELHSEWREFAEEKSGRTGKKLLQAARLQRNPEFYVSKFGAEAYDIMLGDCFWAIYQMIGKLSYRIYLLSV